MKQLIYKTIYNSTINRVLRNINKAIYPILPGSIKIPPSGTLRLHNSDGKVLKIRTNQTNYVTHLLFWEGYQNFEYTDIFIRLIKKVKVFYDIGANIGYYSLIAAMENNKIKIVAFEPATGPLFFLKENVKMNHFRNITIEDLAISEKEGEIAFYEIKNDKYSYLKYNLAGEGNTGSKTYDRNYAPISVKTTTLDNYILENKEKNIDLIKIDTEGTENLILSQADVILDKMKPIIICETLYNVIESELQTIFEKYGYEFYNHTDEGLKKVNSIKRKVDNGISNCFFVHPSKYDLINEFVK